MYLSASSIGFPFGMFMNAGINFGISILLNCYCLNAAIVSIGSFLISTDEYLNIISFLVYSSVMLNTFSNAFL
jgi:hypothetical protein